MNHNGIFSRWLLLISAIVFYACGTAVSTRNEAALQAYKQGRVLEKKGDTYWYSALKHYRRAVEQDSRFYEAYLSLARLYEYKGNALRASENYQKVISLNPNLIEHYLDCGRTLYYSEKYNEALMYLQQFHTLHPDNPDGLYWLAETERALDNPVAEDYFLQLTRMDSQNVQQWESLALYYYYRGEYDKALPVYQKIVRSGKIPGPNTYFEYGYCLVRLQRWKEAADVLETAARQAGEKSRAHDYWQVVTKIALGYFKGEAFIKFLDARMQLEEIRDNESKKTMYLGVYRLLKEAVSLEPDFILAHQELAAAAYTLGYDDEAITAYEKVIAAGKADADAYANAAYLYFRKNDFTRAAQYYEASLGIKPEQDHIKRYLKTTQKLINNKINKEAYWLYDKALNSRNTDSSVYYLRQALAVDTAYYEAWLQLGATLTRSGQYLEGEQALLKGRTFCADTAALHVFHYQLAMNYSRRDLHDKAIAHFDTVIMLDPYDYDARYELAKVHVDRSDLKSAMAVYDRLVRDNPDYFRPADYELKAADVDPMDYEETSLTVDLGNSLKLGQVNTYRMDIVSKQDALLPADANGDSSRQLTATFTVQVIDTTSYGVSEMAVEILSIDGYALLPQEIKTAGQKYYVRVSDVFGVINIYGLLEENPYSVSRLVLSAVEDLYGSFLRKPLAEGELFKTAQRVFKLGSVDAVGVIEDADARVVTGKKHYGIFGSYDAARYGEVGRIYIQNEGQAAFEFDRASRLITRYQNRFTTKTFREVTATMEFQSGSYEIRLTGTRQEKLDPPQKFVLDNVPYVKQHGPQCAAASLSMILGYYGETLHQDSIYAVIKSDYAGAQSADILGYPRSLGRYKSFGYVGTLEDLKNRVEQGIPVIVFLTPYGYGHVVVVIGFDETKHQILMHDPTVANNHAIGYDDFLREWSQSGNECVLVVPFDREIILTEGPIATHPAVETKWLADKELGKRNYDQAIRLYEQALTRLPNYEAALEGKLLVYLSKDDADKAAAVLDTLLKNNPNSIELILRNASLLLSQYDYDKVLQLTSKIKMLDESNIVNYIYSASALFSQKKYDEAIREIRTAINLNPLISTPRTILSGFLAEKGDWEQAYEQARIAIRYEPENLGNYLNLSGIYQTEVRNRFLTAVKRAEAVKQAVALMDFVRKNNPRLPNLDQIYADIYVMDGRDALADSLFRENIKKYPDENGAYNNLAWRYATKGIRLNEAAVLSQKSIELSKRNPYYFDTLGWIYFKMAMQYLAANKKDSADVYFAKAEKEFKATIEYDIYSDFAYRHLGVVYDKWGRKEQAQSQYDIVLGMLPDQARTCVEIAQDCEEGTLWDRAAEYYQKALNIRPNMDYAAYKLAYLYVRLNKSGPEAMIFADLALEQDTTNFLYRGMKGIVHYYLQQYEPALKNLERAVAEQENYFDEEAALNHYFLALTYQKLNQKQKALAQFQLYLKRAPDGEFAVSAQKQLKQ